MNDASDLPRRLRNELSWSTENRQLRLRSAGDSLVDRLLPQHIVGTEAICGGLDYRVACLSGMDRLPLKELIALPVEIQIQTDRGQPRSVCGIVTEARAGDPDGGLMAYHLVVRDVLAVMEKRTNSRVFRGMNEVEIVRLLCDEWRQSNVTLANAFELELDPLLDMAKYPRREQTMQYNESDAAFVRRLLKRSGISFYIRPGRSRSTLAGADDLTPAHTLVLFDDAASLPQNAAGTVRYHREDATDGRDVITSFTATHKLQSGKTVRFSPDYRNPGARDFMTVSAWGNADQGSRGNELAAALDDYLVDIPHAGNDMQDNQRLGQLRMSRHEFETKCFHGAGCVRAFCAGEVFTLDGHPGLDTDLPIGRDFVITQLEVETYNNLPKDVRACGERSLKSGLQSGQVDAGRVRAAQVRFTAVGRDVPLVPAFDPRVDLPHPQLQSAFVVGPPGEDVHCDALGRVKIRFPGMRPKDHEHAYGAGASDGPADSAWVRVASNWAGSGPGAAQQCGTLALPRVGTEVLVTFLGGDPDRPIIVGQLYNGRALPPAFSGVGDLPGNRYLSGTRTREVHGARGNQLRFDDTPGEIGAQLASDHGASELNLGFLTQARADGTAAPRGEGAELRSDEAVAIRGGKGVLITAEASPGAEGPQLGRAGLVGAADVLCGMADEICRLAGHHADDEATERLAALADKLHQWHKGSNVAPGGGNGGPPVVAVTAPGGLVMASADDVLVGSERKVTVASAGDTEVAAGRNIFVRAARGLSLFAHALGIKLVAASGNVSVQTHKGHVEIKSAGRISLIATEGIDLQAPEIKVAAHGAQTDWGRDAITQQCAGTHVDKAAQFVHVGPSGGTPVSLNLPNTQMATDERVVLRHRQTREPLAGKRYSILLDDGSTVDGTTDAQGRSALHLKDLIRVARVHFIDNESGAT
jgi:type VI secretion system secreted protein VgrG